MSDERLGAMSGARDEHGERAAAALTALRGRGGHADGDCPDRARRTRIYVRGAWE
jgi:hypothetical protein